MNLKKKDRDKVDTIIDKYVTAFKWCFNEEFSSKYLERFANMKYESSLYNLELLHLRLEILDSNGIDDTYEGIKDKEIDNALRSYFIKTFKRKMKDELPKHFEELRKKKKEEAKKEAELKKKK